MTELTLIEADSLCGHEATIERHLETFVAVGEALMAIRDGRLYRGTHDTFEAYCRERWDFTPQHGGRLIVAAEIAATVEPMGSIPNERVARELAPLRDDPDTMREAWADAVQTNGHAPTATQTREAVRRHAPRRLPDGPVQRPPREILRPVAWVAELERLHAELRDRMRQPVTPEVVERYRPGLMRLEKIRVDLVRFTAADPGPDIPFDPPDAA